MHLKLQTDFGLRILIYLARQGGRVPVDTVASAYDVSREHLVKVAQRLQKLGYIRTYAGRGGGMELARAPAAVDVGEVVARLEGRDGVLECVADSSVCVLEPGCRLRRLLISAEQAFYDALTGSTLADLVHRPHPRHGLARLPLS